MAHLFYGSVGALLERVCGSAPPSAAELTERAGAAAAAELACARSEARGRVLAATLQQRTSQQAAMRQCGLEALDVATLQGNPAAARQALTIIERESH